MKKVICLSLLMFMLFAGAVSAAPGGLLDGKPLTDINTGQVFYQLTDNDTNTSITMGLDGRVFIFELPGTADVEKVYSVAGGSSGNTPNIYFYDESGTLLKSIRAVNNGFQDVTVKSVKSIGLKGLSNWGTWIAELDIFGTVEAPRPVGLSAESQTKAVELRWTMTEDERFVGYDVYRNDVKITPQPIKEQTYIDTGGEPDVMYRYKIAAVYNVGVMFSDEIDASSMADMLSAPNLQSKAYHNRLNLSWSQVGAATYRLYHDNAKLYDGNGLGYAHVGLQMDTEYTYKLEYIDKYGRVQSLTKTFKTTDDETDGVLDVPEGLKVDADVYDATMTWDKVANPDLDGYFVYLNGSRVGGLVKEPRYQFTGLKSLTEYKAHVVSVDKFGNLSDSSDEIVFKTKDLTSVPEPPTISGKPFSASVTLSWAPSKYAERYKVIQDGKMIAETDSTSFRVRDLKNGTTYKFSVVAVNRIGDSSPSNVLELTPDSRIMPDISLGYQLQDVALGTSSWFTSIWRILAFVIAIPLAFYVANRVKGLLA
ncbi:fibronectin type III domain-containing protein [Paenibacillus thiaminolyticus]|uniref:Fibronectin type-III domain-containing protein n=1 Tax=Paenibacillus thiaminolyticus TaxID=49283 RepID=A0A3A3GYL0_PANTH|nr:fibronectin type III domain-containing protein [Paenibacillus thiaminolyticus]RJG23300.1 hypothetical protein DQX05_13710 [Paenibacillus thiaminolyticus]RJG23317.1 hypothetical protein DQX05_13800 [Paenibacillus thiaminolyticus]